MSTGMPSQREHAERERDAQAEERDRHSDRDRGQELERLEHRYHPHRR